VAGNGQFWLVLRGAALAGRARLDPNSCIYVSCDEPQPAITAGPQGAAVLIVQFPKHG
jgi:hypothetical protein